MRFYDSSILSSQEYRRDINRIIFFHHKNSGSKFFLPLLTKRLCTDILNFEYDPQANFFADCPEME